MTEVPENQKAEVAETIYNHTFSEKASALRPTLYVWPRVPQRVIDFVKDETAYFGLKPTIRQSTDDFESSTWGKGDEFILDFGIHMVGRLTFRLSAVGINIDAPCRLRLTFGESPIDVTETMDNVKTWISTSWLPDEIINVDVMPEDVYIPRRYSFRYLRVQVVDTSPKFKVSFSNVACQATSSVAPTTELEAVAFSDPVLQVVDSVSIFTLRDCMQTVFEDGPRRDRRLWLGDLRLQALVNYSTFRDFDLVKRNLYMFAALPRVDRSLPACVFELPNLLPASDYIVDYDILFGAVVCDYVSASGDVAAGHELWATIQGSLLTGLQHLDPQTSAFDASRSGKWKFLDWAQGLDTSAGLHGVLLYTLRAVNRLAKLLALEEPYKDTVEAMQRAAAVFVDHSTGSVRIVSGPGKQVSLASVAWLTLADALPTDIIRAAMLHALSAPEAVRPLTPYLWHHVAEALAVSGLHSECVSLIKTYWGGMVRAGADTFWECFDPTDARASPYGDVRNNSFCHAWSCTPSYLLRGILRSTVGAKAKGKVTVAELDNEWINRGLA
jgi:alpha-L-rhamnosidase